MDKGM